MMVKVLMFILLLKLPLNLYSQIVLGHKYTFNQSKEYSTDYPPLVDLGYFIFKENNQYVSYYSTGHLKGFAKGEWKILKDSVLLSEIETRADTFWLNDTAKKGQIFRPELILKGNKLYMIRGGRLIPLK